tara:strand:- start:1840 stop:2613 length:774 start_codon:yes stop_codon:yes gene_type:complete
MLLFYKAKKNLGEKFLIMLKILKSRFLKKTIIYHIYRYFKYKKNYFPSYGATGEDVLINKIFKNKIDGYFVDVGALHPINGSLTYNLSKRGWKGLNIDLLKENLILFNFFRKKDKNINLAISKNKGVINAYIFERGSGVNTTNKKWADKWKKEIGKNYSILKIKKDSLNNVLSFYKIDKKFELLNIDVEGHEIDVLKGINLKNIRPKIITIEIHVKKTEQIFKTEIYKLLKKNNYELISQYYQTSFFKSNEFNIKNI